MVLDSPEEPPGCSPQEAAWAFAEYEAVAVMGTVTMAVARLVVALRVLLDTDGWEGAGIRSRALGDVEGRDVALACGGARAHRPPVRGVAGMLGSVPGRAAG